MNAEPRFTAIDVARHLGVVQDTVYRWGERKGLPAHKIGRRLNSSGPRSMNECVRGGLMKTQITPCSKKNKGDQL